MAEVPEIIRGVGVIGPLADVVTSILPFVKTGYMAYKGLYRISITNQNDFKPIVKYIKQEI